MSTPVTDPGRSSGRLPGRRRDRAPRPTDRLLSGLDTALHDPRLWTALLVLAVAVLLLARTSATPPQTVVDAATITSGTAIAAWVAVRVGASAWLGGSLGAGVGVAALATREPVLVVGAAVMVASSATVLGLLVTVPAARFRHVVREYAVALAVAGVGALTAAAYDAPVSLARGHALVVVLSLVAALLLAARFSMGLHGLGRRGAALGVAGAVVVLFTLGYAHLLATYGTPALRETIDAVIAETRDTLGAVPRPSQMVLGFPALAWGISQRARRRQGWWFTAFGAVALAGVTASLFGETATLHEAVLATSYAASVGLLLGYAVLRLDAHLTGTRGRRARRVEEAAAHRPEPPRLRPLL